MSRRRRRDFELNTGWAAQMLASYRTLNPEQATWFDGAGASAQTELLARLQPGGYLEATFGPAAQNKTACDFLYLLQTSGNVTGRVISKTGAPLRWNIDGTIYSQNNLPSHTLGTGAGFVTVSSLDGWAVSQFQISSNQFIGACPNFNFPTVTNVQLQANQFNGNCPNFNFPTVTNFSIQGNQFSGNCPNFNFPAVTAFVISINQFSGAMPSFNFPAVVGFLADSNQFSGAMPNFNFPALTTVWLNNNNFTSIVGGTIGFITGSSNLKDIRMNSNQLPQADIDRLLAAYHTHRTYYAGLTGNLTFSLQGGNAAPSATGLTHRSEIISAFTAAGRTATITTS